MGAPQWGQRVGSAGGLGRLGRWADRQQRPRPLQLGWRGIEPCVADLMKAIGQDVLDPGEEVHRMQRGRTLAPRAEGDVAWADIEQAGVGDAHAVGVGNASTRLYKGPGPALQRFILHPYLGRPRRIAFRRLRAEQEPCQRALQGTPLAGRKHCRSETTARSAGASPRRTIGGPGELAGRGSGRDSARIDTRDESTFPSESNREYFTSLQGTH